MRIAVVHPTTLLGKELLQHLEARAGAGSLAGEVHLHSTREEEVGVLADVAGAAGFVARTDAVSLDTVDLAFLCGPIAAEREVLRALPERARAILLDPDATASDARPAVAGVGATARRGETRLLSAHPAAVALALVAAALARYGPRRLVATVSLPVSLGSDSGLDDLFEETRRLLTFQAAPAGARGREQRAFNLLPDEAAATAIEAQLARVLAGGPEIAIQVARAGVFHGLALSVWLELEERPDAADLRKALAGGAVELARKPAALAPVAVAGGERLVVGGVRAAAGGYALWAAIDNLVRGGALNALDLAEEMLGERPA